MKTVGIVVVLLIILAGGFFLFQSQQSKTTPTNTQPTTEQSSDTMQPAPTTASEASSSEPSGAMKEATGTVKEFTVTGKPYSFTPNTLEVNKGDTVKVTFKNAEGMHDFVIDEYGVATKRLQTGGEETVTFVADKTGSFEYYCSVGNHRTMGMKGTLTVK